MNNDKLSRDPILLNICKHREDDILGHWGNYLK